MNISVDGGSICSSQQFGTTVFSRNLLKALADYDSTNQYYVYTFCNPNKRSFTKTQNIQFQKLSPTIGWMKVRVSIEELLKPKQLFLALNQALPLFIRTPVITFSHGLSFLQFPDQYKNDYSRLKSQLDDYVKRSRYIIVSSEKIKKELMDYDSTTEKKIITIPFGIPFEFLEYKEFKREKYFMFVGNNMKVKNVAFLTNIFNTLITDKKYAGYKLYLVGPFSEYKSKNIFVFKNATREELLELYRKATAYLSPSLYESFNLPILEALSQRCPVIALPSSIIPEMEKYVSFGKDEQEFLQQMKKPESYVKIFDQSDLKRTFSWRSYVQKLHSLYNIL